MQSVAWHVQRFVVGHHDVDVPLGNGLAAESLME